MGRAEQTQYACAHLYSSRGEDVFMVRAASHDIRRENEDVDLSVFFQEGGHVGTEVGVQKSTGD